jgi:hypothetical protein
MRMLWIVFGVSALLAATGCSRIQPWVKPYERERLADRVMSWERDPISSSYINHAHENGCGCN